VSLARSVLALPEPLVRYSQLSPDIVEVIEPTLNGGKV